ncbi:MAG: hypothetical protein NVSMB1_00720 [Polyangiales bacterium]
MLGYETLIFFERVLAATGRLPRGLADRWFYRVPMVGSILDRIGGVLGSPESARRLLDQGHLVVCYPGGAREVFKHDPLSRYRLQWEKSLGFVRLALSAGVPIIPFAAAGVDDGYSIVRRWQGSGQRLMGDDKYDLPLLRGAFGPFPRRVPFWFRIGAPIHIDSGHGSRSAKEEEEVVALLHRRVWDHTQAMLDDLVKEWNDSSACAS